MMLDDHQQGGSLFCSKALFVFAVFVFFVVKMPFQD